MNPPRSRSDDDRVRHIKEAATKLAVIAADSREAFDAGWVQRLAAERLLGIIGEAGRHLSEGFVAARPALEVAGARDMRNFLAHQYDDVDPDQVWYALTVSAPAFAAALANAPTINPIPPGLDV